MGLPTCPSHRFVAPTRIVDFTALPPVECPCGQARRGFVDVDDFPGTIHVTEIGAEARRHYHQRLTETYYVLECESGRTPAAGRRHHPPATGPVRDDPTRHSAPSRRPYEGLDRRDSQVRSARRMVRLRGNQAVTFPPGMLVAMARYLMALAPGAARLRIPRVRRAGFVGRGLSGSARSPPPTAPARRPTRHRRLAAVGGHFVPRTTRPRPSTSRPPGRSGISTGQPANGFPTTHGTSSGSRVWGARPMAIRWWPAAGCGWVRTTAPGT